MDIHNFDIFFGTGRNGGYEGYCNKELIKLANNLRNHENLRNYEELRRGRSARKNWESSNTGYEGPDKSGRPWGRSRWRVQSEKHDPVGNHSSAV